MHSKAKTARRDENHGTPFSKIIIGAVLGSALYFIFLAIFAAMALKSGMSSSAYMPAGMLIGAMTGLITGFSAVRPIKQKGALYGAIAGLIQAFICTVVLFIVNNASAGRGVFILSAIMTVCALFGGIGAVNMKRKKKY